MNGEGKYDLINFEVSKASMDKAVKYADKALSSQLSEAEILAVGLIFLSRYSTAIVKDQFKV